MSDDLEPYFPAAHRNFERAVRICGFGEEERRLLERISTKHDLLAVPPDVISPYQRSQIELTCPSEECREDNRAGGSSLSFPARVAAAACKL